MAKNQYTPDEPPESLMEDDDDLLTGEAPPEEEWDEDGSRIVENEDGSVTVVYRDDPERDAGDFDENLAEGVIDPLVLHAMGLEYLELVEQDIEARAKRDKQYAEGIKRTGMGGEAPGGADFEGASKVVHPMLTQGCVDFASRAIKELFPSSGPCKTQIIGEQTEDKLDRAERKRQYMNWQCMTQIRENRAELEKLLSQVPLGGAQYKRWWYDPELKRNRTQAVFIDNVFTPYGHSDFYTSPRVTFRDRILKSEFDRRVRIGLYRDVDVAGSSLSANEDESESQTSTNKVEGVDPDALYYNQDGLRVVYEVQVQTDLDGQDPELEEGLTAPYIFHIDKSSHEVLGVYRNWKQGDSRYQKKHWMTEWAFIPWRDGPAVGLAHIIGSMAAAATGALRAVLDAAHIQNFPGGLMLDGGKTAGESITTKATELSRIKPPAGMTDPDIRKLVMPFPFAGPSSVLFQILEWLTQSAQQVVSTASEKIAEAGNDMPVGTAMALIEHGSANFSAIHARLHAAMKMDLEILHRLNSEYMDDEETVEDLGELIVSRKDFEGPMDIIPVSDPNIFSETQRFAQLQAVMQLKNDPAFAGYFKQDQLLARALKLLQVPDVEGIANLPKDAKKLGALEENYVISSNDEKRPLKAYSDQDHLLHLQMHIQYATSPMLGANPLIAAGIIPGMLQHCKEHLLMLYKQHTTAAVEAMQVMSRTFGLNMSEEQCHMQGAAFAEQIMAKILGPIVMPGLQQMQQMAGQIAESQKPPPSPDVALVEKTKVDIKNLELQQQANQADMDRKQEQTLAMFTGKLDEQKAMYENGLAQLAASVELIITDKNNAATMLQQQISGEQAQRLAVIEAALKQIAAVMAPASVPAKGKPGDVEAPEQPDPTPADSALMRGIQAVLLQVLGAPPPLASTAQADAQQQNILAILEQDRRNNQLAFAQLAQGMQQLAQERQAVIEVGPDGRKRARSFYTTPPQIPQFAGEPQPQQPQGPQQ